MQYKITAVGLEALYHGSSTIHEESLLAGINKTELMTFGFRTQGSGFYTTPQLEAAQYFAEVVAQDKGGEPACFIVRVIDFDKMIGYNKATQSRIEPYGRIIKYKSPPSEAYIRDNFDYVRAKIIGFGNWEEVVFMERAYSKLRLERFDRL